MTLIARYKLDGNAKDSEGTAHGTAIDVTWAPSQLVDGGGEARLNGTTSRIETAIQFTTETAVALPIWFRPHEGAGHLIGQHDGTNGLAIEQTETGKIRLVVNGTASAEVAIYPGEYHHAVPVYDNGEATLYLDNEPVASVTESVTWPAVPVTLGARADGSALLACDVVDVRGYDQALARHEVLQLQADFHLDAFEPDFVEVPSDGLVAHYPLDGSAQDVAGGHHGTNYGAVFVSGKIGQALDFDGTNPDRVEINAIWDAFPQNNMPFTLSAFARFDRIDKQQEVVDVGSGNNKTGFRILFYAGELYAQVMDGTTRHAASGGNVSSGAWVSIVATFDGSTLRLYQDGVEVDSTSGAWVKDTRAAIGAEFDSTGNINTQTLMDGLIDQVRVYDRALSAGEVSDLANDAGNQLRNFPYLTACSKPLPPPNAYNPHSTPVLNPTAIPRSGRSGVQGITALLAPPAWFDQRDGSGGSHLSPAGVVSRSDRQGRLSGNTTDQNGQPVSRRVRCFERRTGRIVRETWSNAAGYYQFDDLDPGKRFTVVAHDYSGTYNAVIADNAQPEVPA